MILFKAFDHSTYGTPDLVSGSTGVVDIDRSVQVKKTDNNYRAHWTCNLKKNIYIYFEAAVDPQDNLAWGHIPQGVRGQSLVEVSPGSRCRQNVSSIGCRPSLPVQEKNKKYNKRIISEIL